MSYISVVLLSEYSKSLVKMILAFTIIFSFFQESNQDIRDSVATSESQFDIFTTV